MPKVKVDADQSEAAVEPQESVSDATKQKSELKSFAELYALANAPFDKIHQRPGGGGRMLDYITGEQAQSRMQEVYNDFGWRVDAITVVGDQVAVTGTLEVETRDGYVSRSGVGAHPLSRDKAAQVAETIAFKRAAAKLGVGAYLYEKDGDDSVPQQSYSSSPRPQTQFANTAVTSDDSGTTGVIAQIGRPGQWDDGRPKPGSIKIGDTWFRASGNNPIDVLQFKPGQRVHITHPVGKPFINGIRLVGAGAPTPGDDSPDDADF